MAHSSPSARQLPYYSGKKAKTFTFHSAFLITLNYHRRRWVRSKQQQSRKGATPTIDN